MVVTLLPLAAPRSALAQGLQISVSPTWGPTGTEVTVRGTGWPIQYYPSVHLTITERRGDGFPTHLGDEYATPDKDDNFVKKIKIPASATPGIVKISAIIGNGSGANADFYVGSQPPQATKCPLTFIGLHGISEGPDKRSKAVTPSKAVIDVWTRFSKLAKDRGVSLYEDPDHLEFPKLEPHEFVVAQGKVVDPLRILGVNVPSAINEGVAYLEEAAKRAQSHCAPARLVIVGYSEGAWIARQWLEDTTWSKDAIVGIMTIADPQWDDGQYKGLAQIDKGLALKISPHKAIQPYRPANPLGWRFGAVCNEADAICGRGYDLTHAGHSKRSAELLLMLAGGAGGWGLLDRDGCRAHCPDVYINNGATTQVANWLIDLALVSK